MDAECHTGFPAFVNGQAGGSMEALRQVAKTKAYPATYVDEGGKIPDVPKPLPEKLPYAEHEETEYKSDEVVTHQGKSPDEKAQAALKAIKELIGGEPGPNVDQKEVERIAKQAARDELKAKIKDGLPQRLIVVKDGKKREIEEKIYHCLVPEIIKIVEAKLNLYTWGPSQSGKTSMAAMVAKAIGLKFYFSGKVEKEQQLVGWTGATGEFVGTQFYEAYTKGGLFLFDEMDSGNPRALIRMNAALANGYCDFPSPIGVVQQHKDFRIIGCGNTPLNGATAEFSARAQFDAAIKERFPVRMLFDYDNNLEKNIASQWECGAEVAGRVQAVRKAVAELKVRHTVTMKTTFSMCELINVGFTKKRAEELVLFPAVNPDTVKKIENHLKEA